MKARDYQEQAINNAWEIYKTKRSALVVMATGLGKCFAKDTPIMMYDGTIKPVQDVRVNDLLMGPDYQPRTVTSLASGIEQMYRVKQFKFKNYTVNKSHILSLYVANTGISFRCKDEVYKGGEICNIELKDYVKLDYTTKRRLLGYRAIKGSDGSIKLETNRIEVIPLGIDNYYGFTLEGNDRRFLLGDFTVAHNTITFAHAAKRRANETGKQILVIAHREELITQAANKIHTATGLLCEIEMADQYATTNGFFERPDVIVATVQTLYQDSRLNRFDPDDFAMIIIDEAHRAVGSSYRKVIDYFMQNEKCVLLGVTATPDRADEQALGQIFDAVALDYGIAEGIKDGWLVPIDQLVVEIQSMDLSMCRTSMGDLATSDLNEILEQSKVLHEMAVPVQEIAKGEKTLVFASSVQQSQDMAGIFNKIEPGSTEHVDGKTAKDIRRDIVSRYYHDHVTRLVNCACFTEGFDDPGVKVVAICRPTKSRPFYAQMCGRATRPAEDIASKLNDCENADERRALIASSSKPQALIIDMVGNAGRHKLVTMGDILGGNYPDEVIELAKENNKKRGKPEDVMTELERAEAELAERRRKAELAKAKERIKYQGKYYVRNVSPFDVLDIVPCRIPGYKEVNSISPKQLALLQKWGIPNADQITNSIHASQVINAVPPSNPQKYRLRQVGLPVERINRMKANKIIPLLAKNGWRMNSSIKPMIEKIMREK